MIDLVCSSAPCPSPLHRQRRDAAQRLGYDLRRGAVPLRPDVNFPWIPAHVSVGPASGARHTGLLLHGILGSARNLRTLGQQLSALFPTWRWVIVDLRGHGDSLGAPPPHTVQACVGDLIALCNHLNVQPSAVIGHSFGGKVALELARPGVGRPWAQLQQVWALDTQPHLRPQGEVQRGGVLQTLQLLRDVPQPLAQRSDVVRELTQRGEPPAVAQWMTTNLVQAPDGLRWRFDLDVIDALLASYFATDSWPCLRQPPPGLHVHLLRAGREPRWTAELLAELHAAAHPQLHLHLLPNAGHWVHVDDLPGLLSFLAAPLSSLEP